MLFNARRLAPSMNSVANQILRSQNRSNQPGVLRTASSLVGLPHLKVLAMVAPGNEALPSSGYAARILTRPPLTTIASPLL